MHELPGRGYLVFAEGALPETDLVRRKGVAVGEKRTSL